MTVLLNLRAPQPADPDQPSLLAEPLNPMLSIDDIEALFQQKGHEQYSGCLLYTSPSPRD